ncbi:MAG: neutral zinc metallopeptidase [Acidimicrobiia bacterium]|nr:neutral zinc metallopeptidase [Acidimicrobiia bacterium]
MRWDRIQSRGNVEDRRSRPGRAAAGGVGGLGIIGLLLYLFLGGGGGGSLDDVLGQLQGAQGASTGQTIELSQGEHQYADFASAVLGSTNDVWTSIFANAGLTYHPPTLVLFRGYTDSGCGGADSSVGPHYCPGDDPSTPEQEPGVIYLDETFFDAVLEHQLGATGGEVAEAYVIAHEVGHHVQNELGLTDQVSSLQQQDPAQANALSVAMELEADCYAGVWAGTLEGDVILPGELRQAIDAAEAVGDDRIQRKTTGMVNPETWTHGSAEERVSWFMKGHDTRDPNACNTFDS